MSKWPDRHGDGARPDEAVRRTQSARSSERIGLVALTAGIVVVALAVRQDPIHQPGQRLLGLFRRGRWPDNRRAVQVSGFRVGEVSSIELDGPRVLVKFTVDNDVRTRGSHRSGDQDQSLLGTKILEVTSRGDGH